MKKLTLLGLTFALIFLSAKAQPSLTTKNLSTSPVITEFSTNKPIGVRSETINTSFLPTGNYTVEVKAKQLNTAAKGFSIETRNDVRKGFRVLINSSGMDNYSSLNYINSNSKEQLSTAENAIGEFHVFRFAVEGENVHIYRDGAFVTTTTLQAIYNDNYMKDNNGDFELEDMSMWSSFASGQGRTTTSGEFRNGTAGVKLANTNNSSVVASLTIKGLKPSTTYALSLYAKYLSKSANNGNMRYDLKLGSYDGTGTFIRTNASDAYNNIYGSPTNSMDAALAVWTVNDKQFTTGLTDSIAILDIMGWNGNNTYVLDDILLYETEASPTVGAAVGSNLVSNGDFTTDATGWTSGGWPLGSVAWSGTNGGQLQIKETTWANSSNATYSKSVTVTPGRTYKLSAKTSQRLSAVSPLFRSVKLVDGAASVSADYSVPTGSLTTYYTNTTPALTAGPASTSLSMQFTTKTNSSTGTPVTVMTLDDVVLQEYEATFPTYLKYGKAYQSEALNCEIAYINYDLTGAYAPLNEVTNLNQSEQKTSVVYRNGSLNVQANGNAEVIIYSTSGKKLHQSQIENNKSVSLHLNKGIYLVKINTNIHKLVIN